ncbi:hypothetical protein ALC60_02402 [Trachymyrmex zeteki]|uniref:Uncharacterized protein n=1 Tax=Mycetomoellerius zeteki TaxID=64791 RepID=A0A151XEF0_9HYME|nr:hypothetical protein ALC60_02402 [Trachymyrmex zeteki]
MVHPRMGSHDRIHDNSRSYVVVVAHKSPQLEFSNLPENFARKLATRSGVTSPTNFSSMKMNKFLALFSNREPTGKLFLNSRSYGIGSHKFKSTRVLAREGTRRALSFRLLLFSVPPVRLGPTEHGQYHLRNYFSSTENVAIRNTANKKRERERDNFSRDTLRYRDSTCNSRRLTQFNEKCIVNIHGRDRKHRGKRHHYDTSRRIDRYVVRFMIGQSPTLNYKRRLNNVEFAQMNEHVMYTFCTRCRILQFMYP